MPGCNLGCTAKTDSSAHKGAGIGGDFNGSLIKDIVPCEDMLTYRA